jgi:hypothetical protein
LNATRHSSGSVALLLLTVAGLTGCAIPAVPIAQTRPPATRPLGEIVREERGQVLSVSDTRIDLSTGTARSLSTHTPAIPAGPLGLRVPIQLGGEKRVEVPAEQITVQLANGKMISVVQELSSPPFAPGERVRILHERPSEVTGQGRTRIVRE